MRLFDGGRVPNARRVRIFLAEKGITVPLEPIDIGKMEHKTAAYLAKNVLGRVPALELDDGTIITESVAICRYFEEIQPEPALFGRGALGKAEVEMWNRRAELELTLPVQSAFRHTHPAMIAYEVPQIPEWGEANRHRALEAMQLFDSRLSRHRFVAGDAFSIADITAFVAIEFLKPAKIALPEAHVHLRRWHAECSARPSAGA